jgi:glycosyltransferase involved in cell wall biosynthesis
MARIEGIKNQLSLIRAVNGTDLRLYIHGNASPNHQAYYEACKKEAGPNVHLLPWIPEQKLYELYASAKVHVLPSFFETTGLSSLEAAVMGCNVVVTDRGDVRDYFGDHAWYCDPEDVQSIRQAILDAHAAPYEPPFRQYILDHYTWQRAGEETLKAYRDALPHLFRNA